MLATCFASGLVPGFLAAAAGAIVALAAAGRRGANDMKLFAAGGAGLWWCLLRAGINADVAGVVAALCISTNAKVTTRSGKAESLTLRAISRLEPLSAFLIMPLFALANTAVQFGAASVTAAPTASASVATALGVGAGLLLGKPLGIVGFTWFATKSGACTMPVGMRDVHLAIVGMLGGIGFTMCLLLSEVALPPPMQAAPKLMILASSAVASAIAAIAMSKQRPPIADAAATS